MDSYFMSFPLLVFRKWLSMYRKKNPVLGKLCDPAPHPLRPQIYRLVSLEVSSLVCHSDVDEWIIIAITKQGAFDKPFMSNVVDIT